MSNFVEDCAQVITLPPKITDYIQRWSREYFDQGCTLPKVPLHEYLGFTLDQLDYYKKYNGDSTVNAVSIILFNIYYGQPLYWADNAYCCKCSMVFPRLMVGPKCTAVVTMQYCHVCSKKYLEYEYEIGPFDYFDIHGNNLGWSEIPSETPNKGAPYIQVDFTNEYKEKYAWGYIFALQKRYPFRRIK